MCIIINIIYGPIKFQRDLVINLVAITIDNVTWILVTSTYRRVVCKMFFVSLDDSDHFVV